MLGQGSLVLSRWHVSFDRWIERPVKHHLWLFLVDSSIQCWNLKGFIGIANTIGKFILMEDDQLLGFKRCSSPRVLVEMDCSEGLPAEWEVIWDGGFFV